MTDESYATIHAVNNLTDKDEILKTMRDIVNDGITEGFINIENRKHILEFGEESTVDVMKALLAGNIAIKDGDQDILNAIMNCLTALTALGMCEEKSKRPLPREIPTMANLILPEHIAKEIRGKRE